MNSTLHKLEIGAGSPCPAVGLPPCSPHGWNAETPNASNLSGRKLILLDELIDKDEGRFPAEDFENTEAPVQETSHSVNLESTDAMSLRDIEFKLNLLENTIQNHALTNWNYLQDDLGKLHDGAAAFATRCEYIEKSMKVFAEQAEGVNAQIGNLQSFSVTTVPDLFRDMTALISQQCGGQELSDQLLPQLQQSTATLVKDVFRQLETRIDSLENMVKSLPTDTKKANCIMSMGMPMDYIIYRKDLALKDVPFAQAVLPAGFSKVDPFKGATSDDESYYCSERMPSDSESEAMQCMQHNFLGAGRPGPCTSHNTDTCNSRPLITLPRVRISCAGQHVSHSSYDSCDEMTGS